MFPAIEAGDMDALRACFAPGAVVWHNDDEKEASIDEVCANLGGLSEMTGGLVYVDQTITRAGNKTFSKHVLTANLPGGGKLRVPALMQIETNDEGLVTRIDEYYDSRTTDCLQG